MEKDPARRRFPLQDRLIEVIDDTLTGEVLLDEALKLMKTSEKMSVHSWIDLMSGITPLPFFLSPHPFRFNDLTCKLFRRDMEPYENRLPTQASSRTPRKGIGRQGN